VQKERLETALERARRFHRAVELARDTIQSVAVETHRRWADHLNLRVAEILRTVGTRVEDLRFGEDLDFSVKFWNGQQVARGKAVVQLSAGARDQLHFAVRLAVSEYLSRGQEPVPLLIDDAFASSDDARARAGMKLLLEHFATRHQIIMVTCHRRRYEALAALDPELYSGRVQWLEARTADSPA
jgi:chromosome segregation protein